VGAEPPAEGEVENAESGWNEGGTAYYHSKCNTRTPLSIHREDNMAADA